MKIFDAGRPKYGKTLEQLLDTLHVENVLRVFYTVGTSGSVFVDVETNKDGIYSFSYEYGNLEFSQDNWSEKTSQEIKSDLLNTAIRFSTLQAYYAWRAIELFDI